MKKLLGSMKKPKGASEGRSNGFRSSVAPPVPTGDGPEAIVYREVGSFCESGAPGSTNNGDEYLHLPAIVDAAESSPSAATQAAVRIRGYLGRDHYDRGFAQYNAIMLTRILTDNPGRVFTQNFDKEFIATVKKLLRDGKDSSVQQILRETLDYFEVKSSENDTLVPLMDMWRKEKGSSARITPYARPGYGGGAMAMPHRPKGLPPPVELAGRIEEAKTTARLLVQTVQSTPQHELLSNELVKEFAERARTAARSIGNYMNAENPSPDDDTMLTLIETNELLNVAMTKHQRAVLQARKAGGLTTPSPQPQDNRTGYMMAGENVYNQAPPPQPQRPQQKFEQQPMLSPPVINGQGRQSPRNDNFSPPPGPPPTRTTQNVYSEYQTQPASYNAPGSVPNAQATQPSAYNTQAPVTSYQSKQPSAYTTPQPTTDYQPVADNPFSDAADYEEPRQPQQSNYSLFGRNSNQNQAQQNPANPSVNAYGQPAAANTYSQPQASAPQRPGAYNPGFTTTPSYIHRQDSAAANATMHGASPPSGPQR